MVIIQNSGLNSFKILYPFIVFTIIFCSIYFTVLNPFFSYATNHYQKIEQQVFRGKLSNFSISKSGIWLRQGSKNNKIVIRAANFLPKESLFEKATFYIYTKKKLKNPGFRCVFGKNLRFCFCFLCILFICIDD